MFESGALVWTVAERAGVLIPTGAVQRARILEWYFAALKTIEGVPMNIAEAEFFLPDEAAKAGRRPQVLPFAHHRLGRLHAALGDHDWLVGDTFSVDDFIMSSGLKIAVSVDLLIKYPELETFRHAAWTVPPIEGRSTTNAPSSPHTVLRTCVTRRPGAPQVNAQRRRRANV